MFINLLITIEWVLLGALCYAFFKLCLRFYQYFIKHVYPTYLEAKKGCATLRQHQERWLPAQLMVTLVTFGPFLFIGYTAWMIGFMLRMAVELTVTMWTSL